MHEMGVVIEIVKTVVIGSLKVNTVKVGCRKEWYAGHSFRSARDGGRRWYWSA